MKNDFSHSWIFEVRKISSFRLYSTGDEFDGLDISLIAAREQSQIDISIFYVFLLSHQ